MRTKVYVGLFGDFVDGDPDPTHSIRYALRGAGARVVTDLTQAICLGTNESIVIVMVAPIENDHFKVFPNRAAAQMHGYQCSIQVRDFMKKHDAAVLVVNRESRRGEPRRKLFEELRRFHEEPYEWDMDDPEPATHSTGILLH